MRAAVEDHVADGLEEDGDGHQDHDEPRHGEGHHLEDAVLLGGPVLGQDGGLDGKKNGRSENSFACQNAFGYLYIWCEYFLIY